MLWTPRRTEGEWARFFAETVSVHFYFSSVSNQEKCFPGTYGEEEPAYAYLGPRYCPISYWSEDEF